MRFLRKRGIAMADGDIKALQGQIDSLKAELALRTESAEKLFNSKNESMDKRLSGHIKFFNVVFISLAGVIGLITIVSAFYGKYAIKNWMKDIASVKIQTMVDDSKKDLEASIATMKKNIEFNFWYSSGEVKLAMDEFGIASVFFKKALPNAPNDSSASYTHNYIGAIYNNVGNYNKALEEYNESIRLKPDNPLSYINRASVYLDLNQKGNADKDYNMAKELIKEEKIESSRAFHNKQIEKLNLKERIGRN